MTQSKTAGVQSAKPPGAVATLDGGLPWIAADLSAEAVLSAAEASLKVLMDLMPQMVWSTRTDGYHDYYNSRWYEFTGMAPGSTDGEGWNGMFHPEDQQRAWTRWRQSLATGEPYEIEYRLRRHDGVYRWTLGRAMPVQDKNGAITRWIGTCTDIDDAKRAGEQNELLNQELSHRIKNIFAVISGLIGLSSRNNPEMRPLAKSLQERIASLSRAHEFARPRSERLLPTAETDSTLQGLVRELMRPYPAFDEDKIVVHGDDVAVDDRAATPIALAFHELATNSAKYGALSTAAGRLNIEVRREEKMISVYWRETGGPQILEVPAHEGFGSRLTEISIVRQLGGSVLRDWN